MEQQCKALSRRLLVRPVKPLQEFPIQLPQNTKFTLRLSLTFISITDAAASLRVYMQPV